MDLNERQGMEISVVMTTYNGAAFVKEQLDSILAQTVLPLEIIVVDDCSVDNTLDILQEYAESYPIIKVYRNDGNLGAHQNFRKAFSLASCPLIAPSDQDDVWRKDKLQLLRDLLLREDVDLVYSQEMVLRESGEKSFSVVEMPDIKTLMWGNNLKGHTFLFKRSLLGVFDIAKNLSFDYALAMKACMTGKYASTKEPLSIWRRHEGCCTTAISDHPELVLKSVPRRKKILYSLSHLTKEKSKAIEISFLDRARILGTDASCMRLSVVCDGIAKQSYWSMFCASVNNAKACRISGSFKKRLAHAMWALRQPWVFWYDMHQLHALE